MLNNTFATTFKHTSLAVRNVDLKKFSTLLQCAISKLRTRKEETLKMNKVGKNCCNHNIMVRFIFFLRFIFTLSTVIF